MQERAQARRGAAADALTRSAFFAFTQVICCAAFCHAATSDMPQSPVAAMSFADIFFAGVICANAPPLRSVTRRRHVADASDVYAERGRIRAARSDAPKKTRGVGRRRRSRAASCGSACNRTTNMRNARDDKRAAAQRCSGVSGRDKNIRVRVRFYGAIVFAAADSADAGSKICAMRMVPLLMFTSVHLNEQRMRTIPRRHIEMTIDIQLFDTKNADHHVTPKNLRLISTTPAVRRLMQHY